MKPTRIRIVLAVGLVVAGLVAAAVALRGSPPPVTRDLEKMEAAGSAADRETERIIANLEAIAGNLEAGAGMSAYSGRIRRLTLLQRASLEQVAGILRSQLTSLEATQGSLGRARGAASGIARVGREQALASGRSLTLLRELRRLVAGTYDTSARLARRSRYAARLAEDSGERFGR